MFPRDIVCLRNISINTLHKGDDDDDDDYNNNNNNKVVPVITGVPGTISKSCRHYLSNIPVKHKIKELRKTALLGTAHILRKVR